MMRGLASTAIVVATFAANPVLAQPQTAGSGPPIPNLSEPMPLQAAALGTFSRKISSQST